MRRRWSSTSSARAPTARSRRQAIAHGFGTSGRADLGGVKVGMRHDGVRKTWRAVFLRPLSAAGHDLGRALVPFSVAVWDGAGKERGGNKALARLEVPAKYLGWRPTPPTCAELAWPRRRPRRPRRGGNSSRACARLWRRRGGEGVGLAGNLTSIGVIAWPAVR